MKDKVLEVVKLPLRYDDYGQMIFDSNGNLFIEVRGWGKFQYKDNGQEVQDSFGKMITDAFNEKYTKVDE